MPQFRDPLCYKLTGMCVEGRLYELQTPQHGALNQVQVIDEIAVMTKDHDKTLVDIGIYDGRNILWLETRTCANAGYWYRAHGEFTLLTNQRMIFRWRTKTYDTEPADIVGDVINANIIGYVTDRFTTP